MIEPRDHVVEEAPAFWNRWYLMVLIWHLIVMGLCYLCTSLFHPAG